MAHFKNICVDYCDWKEYSLLDSGSQKKLERFGDIIVVRSEPKAWWLPGLSQKEWDKAVAIHDEDKKKWIFKREVPLEWHLKLDNLKLCAKFFNTSKHVGVFPEQISHWRWMQNKIDNESFQLLSLFGYTGVASLVAAANGACVTHVDASKPALAWAKTNQLLSGLDRASIRWILDDAKQFVKREIRRGKTYDAIVMDPPAFGRGPDGQVWRVECDLVPFLEDCKKLLSKKPSFIILTLYALDASALMLGGLIRDMMSDFGGNIEIGELAHIQKQGQKVLPLSLYARWSAN